MNETLATATAATATGSHMIEILLILSHLLVFFATIALVVVTALDNNAMVKIVQIMAGRKTKNERRGKHEAPEN